MNWVYIAQAIICIGFIFSAILVGFVEDKVKHGHIFLQIIRLLPLNLSTISSCALPPKCAIGPTSQYVTTVWDH
jgi:hypothetical protein